MRVLVFPRRWQTWAALVMVLAIIGVALFAPSIAPAEDPVNPDPMKVIGNSRDPVPHPPNPEARLGTTPHQYDVFYTLVWGTRQALGFGIGVTIISAVFGTAVGAYCAYKGGLFNRMFTRVTNALLAFPLMAAITFIVMLFRLILTKISPGSENNIATGGGQDIRRTVEEASILFQFLFALIRQTSPFTLAILMLTWIPYARLVNDQILRLKQTEFIDAARSLGARNRRIILRHLIPNSLAPVVVWATKSIGALVILQATFSYIGLGGGSAWAALLLEGRHWIIGPGGSLLAHWWVYLPITLAIIFFGFVWNLLGDEMNSVLNPRERNE